MPAPSYLEVIPLGGLGEFGMNVMVYRLGDDCVVVDMGMMFPGQDHLGVDVVLPDLGFLDDCGTIHGVVLTHGHEDHIGALPHFLARHDVPVYGADYTMGLVKQRLSERLPRAKPDLRSLPEGTDRVRIGPFSIECIPVAHSIPQAAMIVLRSSVGIVVHTADFKLDEDPPFGDGVDMHRLESLGAEGVLALLSDSTNANVPGVTPSEREVGAGIEPWIAGAEGRVLVTTFASNVYRIRTLMDLARKHGRKVAIVGASMQNHVEVATRTGLLRIPAGLTVSPLQLMELPRSRAMILASGTQGEPLSALSRISVDTHREISLEPGDRVLHSARQIPGNERSIGHTIDHLLRRGAEVVTAADAPIHVSGHPSRDELRRLMQVLKPRYLVPIHGDYRQLHAHAGLAHEVGVPDVVIAESGDVVAMDSEAIEITGRVHVGQVFVDNTRESVDVEVLRDRRRAADDGVVIVIIAVDRASGAVSGYPEFVTRGFVPEFESELGRDAERVIVDTIDEASPEERADESLLRVRVHSELKRFLRRRLRRHPLIVPVIVEL